MKTTVILDDDLASSVEAAAKVLREKRATVLRLAIRAGLPAVMCGVSVGGMVGDLGQVSAERERIRQKLIELFGLK